MSETRKTKPRKAAPRREPHVVNDNQWWYEERDRVTVVAQCLDAAGQHLGTTQVRIPWKRLLDAAKRCVR